VGSAQSSGWNGNAQCARCRAWADGGTGRTAAADGDEMRTGKKQEMSSRQVAGCVASTVRKGVVVTYSMYTLLLAVPGQIILS